MRYASVLLFSLFIGGAGVQQQNNEVQAGSSTEGVRNKIYVAYTAIPYVGGCVWFRGNGSFQGQIPPGSGTWTEIDNGVFSKWEITFYNGYHAEGYSLLAGLLIVGWWPTPVIPIPIFGSLNSCPDMKES